MCKCFLDFFDFICCLKFVRMKEKRRQRKRNSTTKYGTEWQTIADKIEDPTLIDDKMVTKEIDVRKDKFSDRIEWFNEVLRHSDDERDLEIADREALGHGAFGEVYKLVNKKTGIYYAVKVMRVGDKEQRDIKRFKSFRNEIYTLARSKHRNIIQLFGHCLVDDFCFMIMEFATNGDLKQRIYNKYSKMNRGCDEKEAKDYFVQISNALYFVHKKGLIHGDLKLENVLVTHENGKDVLKVSDFGCARIGYKEEKGEIRQKDRAVGTVTYMAPEQLRVYLAKNLNRPDLTKHGNSYNPQRADVWSLGICLYRMLANKSPFEYNKRDDVASVVKILKVMRAGFDIPEHVAKMLSADCLDMLKSLLEWDKHKRLTMESVLLHMWIAGHPNLDKVGRRSRQ